MTVAVQASRPTIYVTESDFELLSGLARATADRVAGGALLAEELERAVVVKETTRRRFVQMYSKVTYEDLDGGQTRTVEIVLPEEADIDSGRVSVVTPVGAALIGMTVGETFLFSSGGRARRLRVVEVGEPSPPAD